MNTKLIEDWLPPVAYRLPLWIYLWAVRGHGWHQPVDALTVLDFGGGAASGLREIFRACTKPGLSEAPLYSG
jgi:hypothetical protein